MNKYNYWLENVTDKEVLRELESIKGDSEEINERFYRDLEFGTGGLRGELGAGSNRLNIYTIAHATQGYSNYLAEHFSSPKVAIAYDSRNKSDIFARVAASVFAANNIKVYIYRELMPTPALSFAVRKLGCDGGIVITASHNPAQYNGYKVYGSDGCQITLEAAEEILAEIEKLDMFEDVRNIDFDDGIESERINYIEEDVIGAYIDAVSERALNPKDIDKAVSIVYTPLNGTGRMPVTRCLRENGYTNIVIPPEQEMPDGDFPTCPYPNPEIREALEVGLRKAEEVGSDMLLATDPDADRIGIAVRDGEGNYELINGNQMGILLFNYICSIRRENGSLPDNPVVITTIVSTRMIDKVAAEYGAEVRRVLTGFKFIGEQIGFLEEKNQVDRYVFGFEESYGYLSGPHVRDKDAVNGALLICEMFAHYKKIGKNLLEVLDELYNRYGYFKEDLQSITFPGAEGVMKMKKIMNDFRENTPENIAGVKVVGTKDYSQGVEDLPKSNVLEFQLEGNISIIIRPSGTEPKIKIYYLVEGDNREKAEEIICGFREYFSGL
ncbi:phospho-sugar mutase [Eubacterium xylanophilum]|uniref:phospho-sugar mutase n=1 Tax=Eubacterium xylanophilum TaxID=39497 RepID=UPI00047EE506|nr:phospho-sugar mutase [Eubacterium xylanophilum]